jgi:hypothetical protein
MMNWLFTRPWYVRAFIGTILGAIFFIGIGETGRALLGKDSLWDYLAPHRDVNPGEGEQLDDHIDHDHRQQDR